MCARTAARPFLLSGLLIAVLAAIAALCFEWLPYEPADLPLQLRNKDFANYWMAGKLSLEGRPNLLFGSPQAYFEAMKSVFGNDYPWHNWSYPPHAALFLVPLGLLDFLPAMALFLGLTLALYLVALSTFGARLSPMAGLLLLPFVVANLIATQNGFLTAALLIAGLSLRDGNPVLAGVLFGILTFKPQLGFLLPILLIVEGRWRLVASAALTTALLVLASLLVFGASSWQGYFAIVAPYQTEVMNTLGGDFPFMMGSAFGAARSYGLAAEAALLVHLPFAAAGAALFALALRRIADFHARAFATLLATLLISPYSAAYDFGAAATFAALWPVAIHKEVAASYLRISMLLVAILPVAMLPLGQVGLPLTPVVLLAALCALLASEGAFRRPSRPNPATR